MCIIGEVLFRKTFQFPPSALSQVPIWSVPWSAHQSLSPTLMETDRYLMYVIQLLHIVSLAYYPFHLTHNGQCSSLGKFAFNTFQDLQLRSIQLAPVNRAVPWADPVQLLFLIVNGEAWVQRIMVQLHIHICYTNMLNLCFYSVESNRDSISFSYYN